MAVPAIEQVEVVLNDQFRLVMAISLVVMMFTVALSLKLDHFRALRSDRVGLIGGVSAQVIGLPLLTFILILLLSPPASIALGMMIVASCPGGNVSNALTMFARGDTAYSVSLTAISATTAAIVTPASILFWSSLYGPTAELVQQLNVSPMVFLGQTVGLLAIPLIVGMAVSARWPVIADRLHTMLVPVALSILIGLIVVGLFTNWDILIGAGGSVVPVVIIHNASAFALGAGVALLLGMSGPRQRALTYEVGIQNSGLGLLILLNQFGGVGGAVATTAVWGVWHIIAGFILVGLFRSLDFMKTRRLKAARPQGE